VSRISGELDNLWPRDGDRLLRNSADWRSSVTFSDQALSRHAQIWSGYMSAGSALIDSRARDPSRGNELIYPILFCYRHGLEMAMKWIVSRYGRFTGVPDPARDHDLWQLWNSCKRVLVGIGGSGSDERAAEIVESLIKELHDLDRSALSFRYSLDKRGTLIPLPDVSIDLANLRDVMGGLSRFFEGADVMLGEYTSAAPW
jgi:hypothetical protein